MESLTKKWRWLGPHSVLGMIEIQLASDNFSPDSSEIKQASTLISGA